MAPNKPRTWVQYKCTVCDKTFYRKKNAAQEKNPRYGLFCSKACMNKALKTKHHHTDNINNFWSDLLVEFAPNIKKMKYKYMQRWKGIFTSREVDSIILRSIYMACPALQKIDNNGQRDRYICKVCSQAFYEEIYPKLSREYTIYGMDEFAGIDYDLDFPLERRAVALDILQKIYDFAHTQRFSVFLSYMFGRLDVDECAKKYNTNRKNVQNIIYYYQKKIKEVYYA